MAVYLSSSFLFFSTENLYWKPEQPPPSTIILRYSPFFMISPNLWVQEKENNKKKKQIKLLTKLTILFTEFIFIISNRSDAFFKKKYIIH